MICNGPENKKKWREAKKKKKKKTFQNFFKNGAQKTIFIDLKAYFISKYSQKHT
jgi:hypothetical protein